MKTKNINDYVLFGRGINYLRLVKPGFHYHLKGTVKDTFERFIENLDELNLICRNVKSFFKQNLKCEKFSFNVIDEEKGSYERICITRNKKVNRYG